MPSAIDKVICALDFPDRASALEFVDRAGRRITWYKVGLELYLSEGDAVLGELKNRGKKVFLDLKLHDIPNTVAGAVRSVVDKGVDMITVHATGGSEMVKAAKREAEGSGVKVIAVTVLTSLSHEDLLGFGYSLDILSVVRNLSTLAVNAGADGIVCSPREVSHLKKNVDGEYITITPGIRFKEDSPGDQKRVTTPEEAFAGGADYIVIGRSLTGAKDLDERLDYLASIDLPEIR